MLLQMELGPLREQVDSGFDKDEAESKLSHAKVSEAIALDHLDARPIQHSNQGYRRVCPGALYFLEPRRVDSRGTKDRAICAANRTAAVHCPGNRCASQCSGA